jgi:hypothetical protein
VISRTVPAGLLRKDLHDLLLIWPDPANVSAIDAAMRLPARKFILVGAIFESR